MLECNKNQAIGANIADYISIFRSNIELFKNLVVMYNTQILENKSTQKLSHQQIHQLPIWMMHLSTKCN